MLKDAGITLGMVDNGFGIILAKRNTSILEYIGRRLPGLINVFSRKFLELRKPLANVGSILVVLLLKCHGRVATEVLIKETTARQPKPIEAIQRIIGI